MVDFENGKPDAKFRQYTSLGGIYVTLADDSQGIIVELEALQNDLLARLDDLNNRVEAVILEWTAERKAEQEADEPSLDTKAA